MMKQLLQANITFIYFFFLRQIYWSHVCHLGKVKIKKSPNMKRRQAVSVFYQRVCREVISCT